MSPVVLMSGLPASGKTTAAQRLHARLGGVLIRQCDVYQRLGIDLRAWVRRTAGFTRDVRAYERVRDEAYVEMLTDLRSALLCTSAAIVVDAVHGEVAKRQTIYTVCVAHGRSPAVVWCRCDDEDEVRRRFAARAERDAPEDEASDFSVYRHLASLWEPPFDEQLPDGTRVPVSIYDTSPSPRFTSRARPSWRS